MLTAIREITIGADTIRVANRVGRTYVCAIDIIAICLGRRCALAGAADFVARAVDKGDRAKLLIASPHARRGVVRPLFVRDVALNEFLKSIEHYGGTRYRPDPIQCNLVRLALEPFMKIAPEQLTPSGACEPSSKVIEPAVDDRAARAQQLLDNVASIKSEFESFRAEVTGTLTRLSDALLEVDHNVRQVGNDLELATRQRTEREIDFFARIIRAAMPQPV